MKYSGTVTLLQKDVHDPSCIGMTSTAYILEIMCLLLFVFIPRCNKHSKQNVLGIKGCTVMLFLARMAYLANISHLTIMFIEL